MIILISQGGVGGPELGKKVEKVQNFLAPPRMIWTFLNLGKIENLKTSPPSDLIWERFEFWEPPLIFFRRLPLHAPKH